MITPFWRKGEDGTIYESALREQTDAAAAKAQSQAVEEKLTLKEISGTDGRGYYFTATDRAPKPGEYKYILQGMLRLGNIVLAFTVLSNDGQANVVADAMQLLITATHK
jgi:predicted secreted Zn-dependent protease